MSGLTSTGFLAETAEEIRIAIADELGAELGTAVKAAALSDTKVLGFFVGILAERFATLWEVTEAVNSSQDPDKGTDAGLESTCALTGTTRRAASSSEVTLTLTGTPGTSVTSGSKASVDGTGEEFETAADAEIETLTAWAVSTAYTIGDRVTANAAAWQCTVTGTSLGSGSGPDPAGLSQGDPFADGTAAWKLLGLGTGAVDTLKSTSVNLGPIAALAEDITTIETPIGGWDDVFNLAAAIPGSDIETDEALRVRREIELAGGGEGTIDAIRANLIAVTGVTTAIVFHNPTDVTDSDGVPPHAVEAVVQGGADQDIWDTLLASVAAGIATHGTESGTATDSQGIDHTIEFSRPVEDTIFVDVTLIKDPDVYPSDGDAQVKTAIETRGDAEPVGTDVVANRLRHYVYDEVPGILDITAMLISSSSPATVETTIVITSRQLATFDAATAVLVTSSDGTP